MVTSFRETDLWVGVDRKSFVPEMKTRVYKITVELRHKLDDYMGRFPEFKESLNPFIPKPDAIPEVQEMAAMAAKAGIGPMATVAGLFAREVGEKLTRNFQVEEIIVENGGDLFIRLRDDLLLSVYAGSSPLSGKIGVVIPARLTPLGVCTSAGTVGPSLSYGNADAVMVACESTTLADALATALGNNVKSARDIDSVLKMSEEYPEILSVVIICEEKIGIRGTFEMKIIK